MSHVTVCDWVFFMHKEACSLCLLVHKRWRPAGWMLSFILHPSLRAKQPDLHIHSRLRVSGEGNAGCVLRCGGSTGETARSLTPLLPLLACDEEEKKVDLLLSVFSRH